VDLSAGNSSIARLASERWHHQGVFEKGNATLCWTLLFDSLLDFAERPGEGKGESKKMEEREEEHQAIQPG